MNVLNSKWNLIIYYDLSQFDDEMKRTRKLIKKLENECPILENYKDACEMVISSINRRYAILEQNNGLLIKNKRQKRAPFEFVGSFYHMLFRVMDAEDRATMEDNMRNAFSNQEDLKQLVNKQTSIVDSTVNILKKKPAKR